MEIFLNQQKIEFEIAPEEKIEDVVLTLFRWLENGEGKIVTFSIDGKSLDEVFEAVKGNSYKTVNTVEIEYEPAEWISAIWEDKNPQELLNAVLTAILAREEEVKRFAVDVQVNRAQEAFETTAAFIHDIRRLIMTLSRLTTENRIAPESKLDSGLTIASFSENLNRFLKEINSALQEEDLTLTGDLLEYEILPQVHSLKNFIDGNKKS